MVDAWLEYQQRRDGLWANEGLIPWIPASRSAVAEVVLNGAPADASAVLVIRAHELPFPSGQFTVVWRNERVISADLNGPAHRRVPTPHRQWLDDRGEHVEPMDLAAMDLRTFPDVLRWFLTWTGIIWRFEYSDPPLQSSLPTHSMRRRPDKKR